MKWLKDALGINRYRVEWAIPKFLPNYDPDFVYKGSTGRTMSIREARFVANSMNKSYGTGTHWVVPS